MTNTSMFFNEVSGKVAHEIIMLNKGENLLVKEDCFVMANKKVKRLFHQESGVIVPEYRFMQDFKSFFVVGEEGKTQIYRFNKEVLFTYLEKNQLLNLYLSDEVTYFNQLLSQ
ncbi:hypothetical protein [Listeria innocua]|nr:hypothetical protein [Listeria innocua]EAD0622424.1 hypothetical protein [Listeria monocytogenes]ECL0066578.1 hypothetical protein [Listeria monocytogenes]MBC1908178.1 hypothetical protein [Listeria innocua]MBC1925982.1 hypothetical protein [Listeria innocua]MBC1927074.1 hypothetical protein [Listeria innocua]